MRSLRALMLTYRAFALALMLGALAMKAVMPAGTMLAPIGKVLTIAICDGSANAHSSRDIVVPAKNEQAPGKAEQSCAFSSLGNAALGPIDPAILTAALAFALALAFAALPVLRTQAGNRLRPPLRAPPHTS
ncbi:MAG: hypothetical protein ACK4Z7_13860 [Novosphingobium sp.]